MQFRQPISEEIFRAKYMINGESDPAEVFKYVAEEISSVEDETKRSKVRDEFYRILDSGLFMPGGRILANARPFINEKSKNYNNCFTIDVEDSMEGIYYSVYEDAMISRMGGGVGFDVSKLRPSHSHTSNGGEASGPVSFLEVFNSSAKTIASGGFRRAAHIALIDADHPDVEEFVTVKQGDENKKLTQFNISVRMSDDFMQAVKDKANWSLSFEGKEYKNLPATELYDMIVRNAYEHNEPGAFFIDRVEKDNNGWWAFKMDRCNPCGEIPMPPYSLCCLGALILTAYVKGTPFTDEAEFDFELFEETIYWAIRFLDNVLDATLYPLDKIEEFSKQWRRVGLGFTGLGDLFAMMRIVYGSEESKLFSEQIGKALRDGSYRASVELAKEKGPAPALISGYKFMRKTPKIDPRLSQGSFIKQLPTDLQADIAQYGLRNINLNTTAPTGTTSLSVGQNCSSGIEPIFALNYIRNIRTGKSDETKPEMVYDDAWLRYVELHPEVEDQKDVPDFFVTTMDIDPYDAIDVQAAFQKYIDHAISKTANLPKGYTFEQYKDLFMYAYDQGLKGFTSFNPDGSMKGVLESSPAAGDIENFVTRSDAPPRPKELPCDIHYVHADKQDFIILASKLNGSLYEIFVDEKNGHDLEDAQHGKVSKKGRREYTLTCDNGIKVDKLSADFNGTYGVMARFISMSLRHGVPLKFIIDQLQRSKEFLGFEKAVSRVLKHYIVEEEHVEYHEACPSCGNTLVIQDGCPTCKSCGYTKCA